MEFFKRLYNRLVNHFRRDQAWRTRIVNALIYLDTNGLVNLLIVTNTTVSTIQLPNTNRYRGIWNIHTLEEIDYVSGHYDPDNNYLKVRLTTEDTIFRIDPVDAGIWFPNVPNPKWVVSLNIGDYYVTTHINENNIRILGNQHEWI